MMAGLLIALGITGDRFAPGPGWYAARIRLHAGQPRRLPTTTRIMSYNLTAAA